MWKKPNGHPLAALLTTSACFVLLLAPPSSAFSLGDIGKAFEKAANDVAKTVEKAVDDSVKTIEKAADDTGKAVEKAGQDTGKTIEKAVDDTGKTAEKAAHDTGKTLEKAAQDIGKTTEKAFQDTGKTIEKAVQDIGQAGETVYSFGVRQIESIGEGVGDAADRVREGKFIDALWHLSVDHLNDTQQNAAKAAQESNIIAAAGQIAATAYGGPGGAAAYASWMAYSQTGDLGLALKIGLITGAASMASTGVADLPSKEIAQIAQKTVLAGAIGGVAVAAAGGDENAIRDGFILAGAAVMIQSIYENETGHDLDAKSSRGEAYCMAAVDPTLPCAPPVEAYQEFTANGKPVPGNVDVTKTDNLRPHVGTWSPDMETPLIGTGERSVMMVTISKYPGMNSMALLHDHVSYTYSFDRLTDVWTIVPTTVAIYYGTDKPINDAINDAATENPADQQPTAAN